MFKPNWNTLTGRPLRNTDTVAIDANVLSSPASTTNALGHTVGRHFRASGQGVPMIMMVRRNMDVVNYHGNRSVDDLTNFVNAKV